MSPASLATGFDLLVSDLEKQALFERLCHRNFIRRKLGYRLIDVKTAYRRKVQLMTEARYNQLLEPILAKSFGAVDWPAGFTPRLLLAVRLHNECVTDLRNQGIADPRTNNPDMLAIIERLLPVSDAKDNVARLDCDPITV